MTSSDASTRIVGGRYRLDRSIGSGGMGTVWQGTDELLGRKVAIKEVRFPPEVGEAEQAELRERTLREARATARLSHPNVVTTYDVVEDGGRPYIVMELLPSRSLSEILRGEGPLPPHRVAQIGLDMLGALETSHKQGVVHRDVKPGNVLLTPDGRAVLTDFGIATMAGDPALTSTGVVLGSPAYMSPERARGHRPGPQGDLWGLGATLYAALEGRPPYDSDNALSTLTSVIADPVPPPRNGGPLAEAIMGLLAKDPDQRMDIPTARELMTRASRDRSAATAAFPAAAAVLDRAGRTEALQPVNAATRGPAPPAAAPAPPREATEYAAKERRSSGLLIAALLVGLLIIGGLVALALMDDEGGEKTTTSSKQPQASATETSPSPSQTEESSPEDSPTEEQTEEEEPEPDEQQPGGVPAGFTTYTDPTGFSVAIPEGWTVEQQSATAIDISNPANGFQFLRIDQTDTPGEDAKKRWQEVERDFREEQENYRRLRLEEVDYRGWEAADWEFTFGTNTHVLNRGFVPNENKGYALYISSPEQLWADSFRVFQVAAETFQPAGG